MNLKKVILIAFVFSGMAALIYEIIWIRPLQYIFGSTIYTISIIFAAFMAGLALGSWTVSKYIDRISNLPAAYAFMELGIGLYGILLLNIFNILPSFYRIIFSLNENFYLFEFLQLLLSFLVLLIPTTLMGATFPVIAKFYTQERIGKSIGEVYSANNIGAILGSFSAGFILIPLLGIKISIIFAGLINILVASLILFIAAKQFVKKVVPVVFVIFLIFAFVGTYDIQQFFWSGFNRAKIPLENIKVSKVIFYKEGLHATVNIVQERERAIALLINGKGQGSTAVSDLRVNFLLAYLPLLINSQSKDALVIGLGTGTTSGQLNQFVKTTTVEIEPAIIEAADYFWFVNLNVTNKPNHKLIIADGRNYLLQSKEKYDIIIPEPSDPWQSFSTALFSKEFFELVKNHLDDDGLYIQWVPIFEMSPKDFRSFYRTFSSVFPYIVGFVNIQEGEIKGLEPGQILLIGSKKPIEYQNIKENFASLPLLSKQFLSVVGFISPEHILNLFLFTEKEMSNYDDEAPIITDDNSLLEFSTARTVLSADPNEVMGDIKAFLVAK